MSTQAPPKQLASARLEMIDAAGRLCQLMGLPRSTGQIFGLLYFSPRPLALDEIAASLAISKGSASTGTRQLVSWQAIRQVWVPGERRDHFEAVEDLKEVLRSGYRSLIRPKLDKAHARVSTLEQRLSEDGNTGSMEESEHRFCRKRLEHVTKLQSKLKKVLPLVEQFL